MAVRVPAPGPPAPRPPRDRVAEYNFSTGPTATTPPSRSTRSSPRTRATPSRATGWSTRRSTRPRARPTPGCARACWAARPTSGAAAPCATGRCSSRPPAATASTWTGRSRYDDVKPYYDKVDVLLGCSGTQRRPGPGAGRHLPARRPSSTASRSHFKRAIAKMGRHYIPGRAGVTTDGVLNNKYRTQLPGPRPLRPRLRHRRRLPLADRARLSRRATPATSTIRPYSVVSEVFLDAATGKRAAGVRVIDANTREVMDFKAKVVVLGAGTPRQHAHPAQLEVGAAPERAGQLLGPARLLPERAPHGPARQRLHPHRASAPSRRSTTAARSRPTSRASAT